MSHHHAGRGIVRALVFASVLVSAAKAHSIWLERGPGGIVARFGEIEEGQRDTLKAGQGWDSVRTSCGTGGVAPSTKLAIDGVMLGGACSAPSVVHDRMPVHGEGKDAGRAVFAARYAPDSGLAVAIDSSLGLDLVPVPAVEGAVRVLRAGKPVAGHKVAAHGPAKASLELVADADGVVRLPTDATGSWTFSAWSEEARSGTHRGSKYAKIWHVATITLERR